VFIAMNEREREMNERDEREREKERERGGGELFYCIRGDFFTKVKLIHSTIEKILIRENKISSYKIFNAHFLIV